MNLKIHFQRKNISFLSRLVVLGIVILGFLSFNFESIQQFNPEYIFMEKEENYRMLSKKTDLDFSEFLVLEDSVKDKVVSGINDYIKEVRPNDVESKKYYVQIFSYSTNNSEKRILFTVNLLSIIDYERIKNRFNESLRTVYGEKDYEYFTGIYNLDEMKIIKFSFD